MQTPFGQISLERYPVREEGTFQAYDSADAYLLDEVAERHPAVRSVLVIGDRHGALTTALAGRYEVTMWADSVLARMATAANLERNGREARIADQVPQTGFDLVLVRAGKARGLLIDQLHSVAPQLVPETPVILGEMVKHLGRWMTEALEEQVGPTSASLAHRKARLLRSVRDDRVGPPPEWSTYEAPDGITLHNAPGTFAASGVDGGTRLLLAELPTGLGAATVVDLGCGNGVLAIASALLNPDARYLLVDDSAAALASARRSWEANLSGRDVEIAVGDGLSDRDPESVDVVLCNPPFHTGTTVDEWVGRRLLQQARRALKPGGELWVVANRHLSYHGYLRQAFSRVNVVAATPKYSVLRAVR